MNSQNEAEKGAGKEKGACPFSHVSQASAYILKRCREIFGEPNLQKLDLLGGRNGAMFAEFLENFLDSRLKNIEIPNPQEMKKAQLVGIPDTGIFPEMAKAFLNDTGGKYVSTLAFHLYSRFVKENIGKISTGNAQLDFINKLHFAGFSLTFVQAFDSIFISALSHAKTRAEWDAMKKSMWRVVLNLARIPTNIQEGMTSSSERIGFMYGKDEPYFIEHMGELFDRQIAQVGLQRAHRDTFEKIAFDGGYGECPALHDGVMKRSFDALHEIYGQTFFR